MTDSKKSNAEPNANHGGGSGTLTSQSSGVNTKQRGTGAASERTAPARQRTRSGTSSSANGVRQRQRAISNDTPLRIRTRHRPAGDEAPTRPLRLPNQLPQNEDDDGGTPPPAQVPAAAPTASPVAPAKPKATKKRKNRKPNLPTELKGKGGYGDPPVAHQFQPGQSGNPRGRPKGDKQKPSEEDMFIRVLSETIPITEQGRKMEVTKLEALVRGQIMAALSGKPTAVKQLGTLWDLSKRLNAKPKDIAFSTEELDLLRSVFGDDEFEDLFTDNGPAKDGADRSDASGSPDPDDDAGMDR